MTYRLLAVSFLMGSLCIACAGPSDGEHDGGDRLVDENPPGDGDQYEDGISKTGEEVVVTIESADPAPPDRGLNTWIMTASLDGQPLDDAIITVSPFMPEHNHGSTPADYVGIAVLDADTPRFEVGPFDLFMPGLWEVTVTVQSDSLASSNGTDEVMFVFDLEG